jgi:hypothetical protein
MPNRTWASLAVILAFAGCSSSKRAKGRIVVAVTVDWEGAYFSPEGLDALDELRKGLGEAPLTHFVSAAYFTKDKPDPRAAVSLAEAVHKGDELAVHLHGWRSLARASGIEPKLSPSFLTGTDKVLELEDGDAGFDTDLDVYSVTELRALIRTSRRLLEQTHLSVSKSFRAGGYLGTPKMIQAIREEGLNVDSSATDYHQLGEQKDAFLSKRIKEVWPSVDATTQPFFVDAPGNQLLEMPITAYADYVSGAGIVGVFDAAHARLQKDPNRDVFVVLGFDQESAQDYAGRIGEALDKIRARKELAGELMFTTVEKAAELARRTVAPKP